jgi:transposase InsO family protein
MVPNWFEDYNKNAPHSALGFKSPIEYRLTIN